MEPIIPIGDLTWSSATNATNLDFRGLPDEVGGRPAVLLALIADVTLTINSAAGGAGITGRNMFDILQQVLVKTGMPGEEARVNNLSGGMCRILETAMLGVEPPVPTDLGAAAGGVTRQLRIVIPIADLGSERPKDTGAPVALLKKTGVLQIMWAASPSALGGNANDTITSASLSLHAVLDDLNEGECPQPIQFEHFDKNGANDATTKAGRFRYASLIQQTNASTGNEFAAGTIATITSLHVGTNEVLRQMTARSIVEKFNKDRIVDPASRRVAPVDTASGVSDFFPLLWPSKRQSGVSIPGGEVRVVTTGTTTSFRFLVVDVRDISNAEREQVLISMGYKAKRVKAVPAAARVPKTVRPSLKGHLKMNPRKKALLPQTFVTLTKEDRGEHVDD